MLYCHFYINNWVSQKAFSDFCSTILSIANLWFQLTNRYLFHMSVGWILLCVINKLMSKRKVKDISERYSFVNYSSDCFADPDYSFQVLELLHQSFVLFILEQLRYCVLFNMNLFNIDFIRIINIFSITFLRLDSQPNNESDPHLPHLSVSMM